MPEQPPRPRKPKRQVAGDRTARRPAGATAKRSKAASAPKERPSRAGSEQRRSRAPRAVRNRPAARARPATQTARGRTSPGARTPSSTGGAGRSAGSPHLARVTRRRLVRVTAFLALPALIATAFLVLHSPLFAIGSVRVTGALETSTAAIVSSAGLNGHPPLIDVNPVTVASRIESLPWIKTALVARHWPRSVTISVTERVPVAEVSIRRHRWELFDSVGRALGFRSLRTTGLVRLQKISPMPPPGALATQELGGEVALADALPVAMVAQVQEVTYSASNELSVTLASGPIAIFGSASALSDKVVALTTLLADHVSLVGVTSINLRVPSSPVLSSAPIATRVRVKSTKSTPAGATPPAVNG